MLHTHGAYPSERYASAQYPITPPSTVSALHAAEVTILNSRLQAWGYLDEPRGYLTTLVSEIKKAGRRKDGLEQWVKHTEEWLEEGDSIVLALERLMGGDAMYELHPIQAKKFWQVLSSTAFNAQWIIAMTLVKLDEVEDRM